MPRFRFKFYFIIFISLLFLFGIGRLYHRLTDDFRISYITYDQPHQAAWTLPQLSTQEQTELDQILKQKFYYLGKGGQCYAFESEDRKYVLKFFKFKYLKPNWWMKWLPSFPPLNAYRERFTLRQEKKLQSVFDGHRLAYFENRKGAELLYLNLGGEPFNRSVVILDKLGIERQVNLDRVIFLIQRKGETLSARLSRQLEAGQLEAAKESISQILEMYVSEYQKGLYDRDHGVMHNTGFVDDHPFHLDVGYLTKEKQMRLVPVYTPDLEQVVWKIDRWIKHHYAQNDAIFSPYLAEQYHKYTGAIFDLNHIDPKEFKKRRKKFIFEAEIKSD